MEPINPEILGAPLGYSNGMLAPPGARLLFVAGQIAWNDQQQIVSEAFDCPFDVSLSFFLLRQQVKKLYLLYFH